MIRASSWPDFVSRLSDKKLGFNIQYVTGFIYDGEVPPDKIYELLIIRWGMGHNFAVTLIDHYGGHIYDIHEKLKELNTKRKSFRSGFIFNLISFKSAWLLMVIRSA